MFVLETKKSWHKNTRLGSISCIISKPVMREGSLGSITYRLGRFSIRWNADDMGGWSIYTCLGEIPEVWMEKNKWQFVGPVTQRPE